MSERKTNVPDALSYQEALRAALSDAGLDAIGPTGEGPPAALRAALRLACALGWCRLLAVTPGDLDGSLTVPWALAGARALGREVDRSIQDARSLGPRWDQSDDPLEGEDLCVGLLQNRMDAWAGYVAIDEAYLGCLEDRDERTEAFTAAVHDLLDRLSAFDQALQAEVELLSLATNTTLLDYWRQGLAEEFRDPLPWWLDGRLEEAARLAEERVLATLPGPEAWKQRRRVLAPGRSWGYPVTRLPPCEPAPLAAAAAPGAGSLPGAVLGWLSPDGAWLAELVLPERSTPEREEEDWPLTFVHAGDGAPAAELAGARVLLGGVEGNIDPAGQARFRLGVLRGAEELTLHVGEALDLWHPVEEGS
jgi:hypothetical protein